MSSANRGTTLAQVGVLAANFSAAIATISLNKKVFETFPYPAALTCIHYCVSWMGIEVLHACGAFKAQRVPPSQQRAFCSLVVCWSVCNALSNVSLERNSVGFYQLAKLMVTPALVVFDFVVYGRRTTPLQAVALLLSCIGVGLASVNDVQLHAFGATIATAAVLTAASQKVLNSHVQQIGGLSSLQVMHNAFPWMALLSVAYVPLMDRRLHALLALKWASPHALAAILASSVAAFGASWSATAIFGLISALAHVLLGQVKTCSVLIVGALLYDARPTAQGTFGALLALAAITAYSVLKLREQGAKGGLVRGAKGEAGPSDDTKLSGEEESSDEDRRPLTGGMGSVR